MEDLMTESVIHLVSDGIVVMDETGTISLINPAANHLFGYSDGELLGEGIQRLLPELFQLSEGSGEVRVNGLGRHTMGKKKKGAAFPLTITITESPSPSGKRFIAIIREVSEKRRSVWEQADKLQKLETLLDHLPDAIWIKDRQQRYTYINRQYEQCWGLEAKDWQGLTDYDVMPEEQAERLSAIDQDVIERGKEAITKEVWPLANCDASYRKITKIPLKGKGESIQGVLSVSQDISEWKQIEELYQYFEKIIDDTFFEIYVFSSAYQYVYLNKCAARSSGYQLEEIQDLSPLDLWSSLSEEGFHSLIEPLLDPEGKDFIRFETIHKRKNDTFYPVEIKLQLVHQDDPAPLYMAIVQDITTRKKVEEIQRKAERAVLYSNILVD